MKKIISIILMIVFVITLSSCSGYNKIMREYLSDPASYHEYTVEVKELVIPENNVDRIGIYVLFSSKEEVSSFIGTLPENVTYEPKEYSIFLEIVGENAREVNNNGLQDMISVGDFITVTTSDFIYMDSNFFYIIALSKDDKVFLNREKGLENMITFMDLNKSVF